MTNYILGAPALPPIANPDWRDTLHTIQRRVRVDEYLTVPPRARAWSPAERRLAIPGHRIRVAADVWAGPPPVSTPQPIHERAAHTQFDPTSFLVDLPTRTGTSACR